MDQTAPYRAQTQIVVTVTLIRAPVRAANQGIKVIGVNKVFV